MDAKKNRPRAKHPLNVASPSADPRGITSQATIAVVALALFPSLSFASDPTEDFFLRVILTPFGAILGGLCGAYLGKTGDREWGAYVGGAFAACAGALAGLLLPDQYEILLLKQKGTYIISPLCIWILLLIACGVFGGRVARIARKSR